MVAKIQWQPLVGRYSTLTFMTNKTSSVAGVSSESDSTIFDRWFAGSATKGD
jgi:hypothetical protein